jgi:hypothetical protein
LHLPGELFVEYELAAQAMRPDRFVAVAGYGDYTPGYIGTEAPILRAVTRSGWAPRWSPRASSVS